MKSESRFTRLAWLLDPTPPAEFADLIWEKNFLHVARSQSEFYRGFFGLETLENALQVCRFRSPEIRVVRDQVELPDTNYLVEGRIDLIRISKAFNEGHTIVINGIHRCCPSVAEFSRQLAYELNHEVIPNVYYSPPKSQGLHPHYDTHDVFVLQIAGTKSWRLYDGAMHPVLGSFQPVFARESIGEPKKVVSLAPGDLLYVPRGLIHEAETDEHSSLHMTVGIYPTQYSDLLINAIRLGANHDQRFREALPIAFLDDKTEHEQIRARAVELLTLIAHQFETAPVMEFIRAEKIAKSMPAAGQLTTIDRLDSVSLATLIEKRTATPCQITITDAVRIQFPGNTIRGSRDCADAFQFISMHDRPFTPADLPGSLSDIQKMELCRRLLRGGLLQMVD